MPTKNLEVVFAELAWIRLCVDRLLAGEISRTPAGVEEARRQAQEFLNLREGLRHSAIEAYANMGTLSYSFNYNNQEWVLRHIRDEIERIFAIGLTLGLCQPLPPLPPRPYIAPPANQKITAREAGRFRYYAERIVVGLIVAYLVYRLGWNK